MKKGLVCFGSDIPIDSIIEHDVLSESGAILVPSGTIVSQKVVTILQNYYGEINVSFEAEFDNFDYDEGERARTLFLSNEMKIDTLNRLENIFERLEDTTYMVEEASDVTQSLIGALDAKDSTLVCIEQLKVSDDYTFKHCVDVAVLSMILAKRCGMSEAFIRDITMAGLLHDIGKTKIPNAILNKPYQLNDEEWEEMKKHPTLGYRMVEGNKDISMDVKLAILEHHENMDGTGYPVGAKGEQIHLMSRMITIADVYDALTSKRVYKEARTPAESLEIMYSMANKFDIELFRKFLDCIILYPVGTFIRLSNGKVCAVIKNHQYYPLRPLVQDAKTGEKYDLLNDPDCRKLVIS